MTPERTSPMSPVTRRVVCAIREWNRELKLPSGPDRGSDVRDPGVEPGVDGAVWALIAKP